MRLGARLPAAVATALALACLPAAAQQPTTFLSGNDLWSHCSGKSVFDAGLCTGYVAGIADALGAGSAIFGNWACLPEGVNGEQAQDVVMRYLEQHPETRYYSAAILVAEALAQAFPCKP
jgi:hypothetical protein